MENIYKSFQKEVISNFYKKSKSNKLILPKDNNPLFCFKDKVILVINYIINGNPISINVQNKLNLPNLDLPKKKYINLYHIGEKKNNNVAYGLLDDTFIYPGIDLGGLTNYKQKIGTIPSFLDKSFLINDKITKKTSNDIYKTWKLYSNKKKFYGNIKNELYKALNSIKNNCIIQFIKVPIEYRVIYTSKDIFNKIGHYYIRQYNDSYAKEIKPNNKLYCAITENNCTPDINKNNILNEYKI